MAKIPLWKKELPMQLTWTRIAVAPAFVYLLWNPIEPEAWKSWVAAGIFITAAMTDWLDGFFARKFKAESNLGRFMDPVADKILVSSALIMLIPMQRCHPLIALILLDRDILIGGIRAAAASDKLIIDAKPSGKWKTGVQMLAVPLVMIPEMSFGLPVVQIGKTLLWLSVALSLISGYEYWQIYRRSQK
jgi:CDP-diacylglycerol---glycerol-3-phosphate 3-phosphatidyltransferase